MKPGRKPDLPSAKRARGTYQPCRDPGYAEIVELDTLPQRPDSLTEAGEMVWLDNVGRVASTRMAGERDSAIFGQFCNLVGALNLAWASGEVPPTSALTEARRMAEIFGLAGARSRLGIGAAPDAPNPFSRNGKRNDG